MQATRGGPTARCTATRILTKFPFVPRIHSWFPLLVVLLGSVLLPARVDAQAGTADSFAWNAPEALELVERARSAREALGASGALETFRADVEGHIYFFVDPEIPLLPSRLLIRVDQVAVEVAWEAPGRLQQHLVGERSEERLPVRDFDYYLDRLTLVPYGFGDEIRVGAGQDVARVPHPFARTAPGTSPPYDYRLGDTVTLTLAGAESPVRVIQVAVRPRSREEPGFVGTIDVDVDSGSIVRMGFTFTPASYVDPRNDRVAVQVEYGLWDGRFWLPSEQRIEVRREVPGVDLGVGTVIRSVLRVSDYRLNTTLPDVVRSRPPFTALPPIDRRAHDFRTGLYGNLDRDGMTDVTVDSDVEALRETATSIVREAAGSGLSSSRLFAEGASSIVRYDRAEGTRFGIGGSISPYPGTRLRAAIGYAAASRDAQFDVALEAEAGPDWVASLRAGRARVLDLGLVPGASGVVSSLGAAFGIEDYRDPYLSSGLQFALIRPLDSSPEIRFVLGVEGIRSLNLEHTSAPFDEDHSFRPVRRVTADEFISASFGIRSGLEAPFGGRGTLDGEISAVGGQSGAGLSAGVRLDQTWRGTDPGRHLDFSMAGWLWTGDEILQAHRLIGGRGTVPGYPYRSFAGTRAVAASLAGTVPLSGLVSARGGLYGGWTGGSTESVAQLWGAEGTDGIVPALSVGIALGWDILRIDLARGLAEDGEWQVLVSVDPAWWPWL